LGKKLSISGILKMGKKPHRIAIMLHLEWPFKRHSGIFAGTQRYAEEQGWHSLIDEFAYDTFAKCDLKSVPYDGVIARANHALLKQVLRLNVPTVNVWASSPVQAKLPSLYPDFKNFGEQCAEHLLARGFRNFATLTPPRSLAQEMIVEEFVRVLGNAGFSCVKFRIPQNPWRDAVAWRRSESAVEKCVDSWKFPIGVYVASEANGRMVVQACHRRGLRVPEDVAIIAGQNEETLCEHPRPSLTSMEVGFERVGYEAARMLHQLMEGRTAPKAPVYIPLTGLVVRESTDFYSVDDEQVAMALQFIAANSHRRIGPNEVARAVNAETRTLQNRFGKLLQRPIATEIRRVRMERAKRELTQSKKRLAEIARDVGFGKIMRMYEVFRRELGVSPGEFRKQMQLKDASPATDS
jgi:LacI family transcriptional regulator